MENGEAARLYRVIFRNEREVYEVYARRVVQGGLFGFVEIEDLVFGERSKLIVDASEDRLKNEFADVKRLFVPLHAVVRIDEVERQGVGRIRADERESGSVTVMPLPVGPPRGR